MNTETPTVPAGMVEVSKEQFFAALKADPRDIMPSVQQPLYNTWESKARELWGWSAPGWSNPRAHREICAVYPAALAKATGGAQ